MLQIAAAHARGVRGRVGARARSARGWPRAEDWGATAHGNEPVDVAIVCTEHPQAIADAAQALAPGGSLCLYAPPEPGSPLEIEGWAVFARELTRDRELVGRPGGHAGVAGAASRAGRPAWPT